VGKFIINGANGWRLMIKEIKVEVGDESAKKFQA
jgi:hypothetical protein